jgi:hypothetical protein
MKQYVLRDDNGQSWTIRVTSAEHLLLDGKELDAIVDDGDHTITFPHRLNSRQRVSVLTSVLYRPTSHLPQS